MDARPFIDSLEFARNRARISGNVILSDLPRLLEMLEDPYGILSYSVQGSVDRQGMSYLDVDIAGRCRLRCQRCMSGLDYPVAIHTRLSLRDQASLDALEHGSIEEEECDSILVDPHLNVLEMLEEEILLSLPFAPKHELGVCQAASEEYVRGGKDSPFGILADLKLN